MTKKLTEISLFKLFITLSIGSLVWVLGLILSPILKLLGKVLLVISEQLSNQVSGKKLLEGYKVFFIRVFSRNK